MGVAFNHSLSIHTFEVVSTVSVGTLADALVFTLLDISPVYLFLQKINFFSMCINISGSFWLLPTFDEFALNACCCILTHFFYLLLFVIFASYRQLKIAVINRNYLSQSKRNYFN